MNTEIFQPNFTGQVPGFNGPGTNIQGSWRYSLDACYRPSVDFKLPIICAAYSSLYSAPGGNLTQDSVEDDAANSFKAYSSCCPDTDYNNKTNIYTLTHQCPYIACFTSNETLAVNFDQCVRDQADIAQENMKKDGRISANATRTSGGGTGRCEYIDFKELRKGVQGGAEHRTVLSVQGVLVLVFAMLLACGGSI